MDEFESKDLNKDIVMRNAIAIILLVVILSGLLGTAAYASYHGYGIIASGNPNARSGSLGGPIIIGGGPGSGK